MLMMDHEVRWGVLSTAGIAQKELIPAFERATNAKVTGIASGSIEKAEAVAQKFSIDKTYDSYEQLLDDPDIDAVYIPLPNHLHKKWVIAAANKGKHILCEKPASMNAAEFKEMKVVCEENNIIFMEAFMYYFHPQHARVNEIIDNGEIGEVKFVRAGFSFSIGKEKATNIRMSQEKGGGSIYDIGCYAIHSIRNVLKQEPKTVHVHATVDPDYDVDVDAVTFLSFDNGVRASFDVSFHQAKRAEYEVFGTEGKISVPRAYRPDWHSGEGLIIVEKDNFKRQEAIYADQYRNQVEHISNVILDQNNLHLDWNNTLANMHVIDACMKSMEKGQSIHIAGE